MRPLLPVLLAISALAALPCSALGKGITDAQVCGASGCSPVDDRWFHATVPEGDPLLGPVAAAPFVTLQVTFQHAPANAERFTYLPSRGVIRAEGDTQWIRLYPRRRAELDTLVAAIEPLPAAQLTGVARPAPDATHASGTPWWPIAGAAAAALALLALLARYATSALKARPRASKSAN